MTASLSTSVRKMKSTDGQTRRNYNHQRQLLAAAVQTVVGGPHTRCRPGRQRGREALPPEQDGYICHVSAILDVLCQQNHLSLAKEQKRRKDAGNKKAKYTSYDWQIGTQT